METFVSNTPRAIDEEYQIGLGTSANCNSSTSVINYGQPSGLVSLFHKGKLSSPSIAGGTVAGGGGGGGSVGASVGSSTKCNRNKVHKKNMSANGMEVQEHAMKHNGCLLTCSVLYTDARPFHVGGLGVHGGSVRGVRCQAVKAMTTLSAFDCDLLSSTLRG